MRTLRWSIGIALLLFQLGAIVYARFVPTRYFCWAPFDMQTDYRIEATVNGQKLSLAEIGKRYRRPAQGSDNRSYQHVIDIVEQVERRYHPDDDADVVMTYRINGKQEQQWRYRRP
jgi:hypothetical protein